MVRGPKREFISRCYNLLLRGTLQTGFTDAQCGFKAIRADVAQRLLPLVEDTGWFFDTELLVLAERAGLRIHEVPVDWVDDPDSPGRHRRHGAGRPARHLAGRARARAGRAPARRAARAARPGAARAERARGADGHAAPARPLRRDRRREHLAHLLLFLLFRG